MSNGSSNEKAAITETELLHRRLFLRSMGKWSGAPILAAVGAGAWLASSPNAAAGWVNRRGPVRGDGWINGGGAEVGLIDGSVGAVGSIAGR
jgi:hypothetical protein